MTTRTPRWSWSDQQFCAGVQMVYFDPEQQAEMEADRRQRILNQLEDDRNRRLRSLRQIFAALAFVVCATAAFWVAAQL